MPSVAVWRRTLIHLHVNYHEVLLSEDKGRSAHILREEA